jgi:hypothetical protein
MENTRELYLKQKLGDDYKSRFKDPMQSILMQDLQIYAGKRGEKLVLENGKLIKVNLVD